MQTEILSKLYVWGSAECDQFLALDKDGEESSEVNRPYFVDFFLKSNITVIAISCGGMHSLYLTDQGRVYSQGCNDDGVLGRDVQGDSRIPGLVKMAPVNLICCGDAHSVAANSNGKVYYWGFYRNTNGPMGEKVGEPKELGDFKGSVQKILSGNNHTLILSNGKVYTCGDADTNVLGRMSKTRNKIAQSLKFQPLGERNIVDVYCAGNAAFLKRGKKDSYEYYGWGLNNYGQLGLGHTQNTFSPTQIKAFDNCNIINMVGGEHHTLALDQNGDVYGFGRNDDGQLGLGEEINEQLKLAALQLKEQQKEEQEKHPPKKSRRSKKNGESALMSKQETDQVFGFEYITTPMKIPTISKIKNIYAAQFYSFAISETNNLYSWGLGQNYLLLNLKEDSLYEPKDVTNILKGEKIISLGLGGQHAIALTSVSQDYIPPQIDQTILILENKNHNNNHHNNHNNNNKKQKQTQSRSNSRAKKDISDDQEEFSKSIVKN